MAILQILIPTWWWCFCSSSGCEKTFITFSALFSHNRTHFREMAQFTCTYPGCDKRYDKACRLKIHLRSHTGEKNADTWNKVISLEFFNSNLSFFPQVKDLLFVILIPVAGPSQACLNYWGTNGEKQFPTFIPIHAWTFILYILLLYKFLVIVNNIVISNISFRDAPKWKL